VNHIKKNAILLRSFWLSWLGLWAMTQAAQADNHSSQASGVWQLGAYEFSYSAPAQAFQIWSLSPSGQRRKAPLLEHVPGQAFLTAARGQLRTHEQRGSFELDFELLSSCEQQSIEWIRPEQDTLLLRGQLRGQQAESCHWPYEIRFSLSPEQVLQADVVIKAANVIRLQLRRDAANAYWGLGAQFSHLDLRGQRYPLLVQEGGVGRGLEPLTSLVNLVSPGSGGHSTSNYYPLPFVWSDQLQALAVEQYQPMLMDFSSPEQLTLTSVGSELKLRLFAADQPLALLSHYSTWAGRQPRFPDWLHRGAIVGMQGGSQAVNSVFKALQSRQTPVSAFWLQDWVGRRRTAIGSQLWWNWELERQHYPDWEGLRTQLADAGIRLLGYVNPFLVDQPGRQRNLYQEAREQGYLIRNLAGEPYPVQNTDFAAGMLDLSNPAARDWFKAILQQVLIQDTGFSGWMADYAEALPLDAVLHSGESAQDWHNRYPLAWSRLNAEAIAGSQQRDAVFFARSGYHGSARYTPLYWGGDQLVSWDAHDGFHSSLLGLLSGGLSGIAVSHSDAGGYTSVAELGLKRSRELLFRWLETNALTAVLRTHEGNQPRANAQFYDDAASLDFFDRCARLYAALFSYRQQLFDEAAKQGWPVVRHPMLHFWHDPQLRQLKDQFMLGDQFMVAPVLQAGQRQRRLYLPSGQWVHLWSQRVYGASGQGSWVSVPAPLGEPPVFYPLGSAAGKALHQNLQAQGLL